MRARSARIVVWLGAVALGSCGLERSEAPVAMAPVEMDSYAEEGRAARKEAIEPNAAPGSPARARSAAPPPPRAKASMGVGGMGLAGYGVGGGGIALAEVALEGAPPEVDAEAPAARAWFPETFLFAPLVATDAAGEATVEVTVPDRLTTWRVLALAHDRGGSQAGAVARFLGTLPVYVEVIRPKALVAGDELELPIQVVNTTERTIEGQLRVTVEGGSLLGGAAPVVLAPERSVVRTVRIAARRPGTLVVKAALSGHDGVEVTIPVRSAGRPVRVEQGGTLAAPREVQLQLPAEMDPETTRARLEVFPGALAVLRSELSYAPGRSGVAEDAYALLLAGHAPALAQSLGGEVDAAALRKMALVAGQRALHHARTPDAAAASLLAEAVLAHPENPVLARLGERLVGQLASSQRPDGTFQGASGWTLQRLLVATADGARAVAADRSEAGLRRAKGIALRASGAFERNAGRIADPYTAAAVVASGAVEPSVAARLREQVRAAVKQAADGTRRLELPPGIVRTDGRSVPQAEADAVAILALIGDPEAAALLPDLGAALLGAYRPWLGWGDGATQLQALRAVLALFSAPLPPRVEVSFSLDGAELGRGVLEGARLREVLALDVAVPALAAEGRFRVEAQPPVPGLGYTLSVSTHVPWTREALGGLELSVDVPRELRVGRAAEVTLRAVAPAGRRLEVRHALPAGVSPDGASLEQLVYEGAVTQHRVEEGAVVLTVPALAPGAVWTARYRVIPTFAGTLRSGPSEVRILGEEKRQLLPPAAWSVRP